MIVTELPPDCFASFLSFLILKDCVCFGSTSVTCLNDILPDILRRRKQMTGRFYWKQNEPEKLIPYHHPKQIKEEKEMYHENVLPTVKERIEGLWKSFPRNHPSKPMICELLKDLEKTPRIHNCDDSSDFDFSDTFNSYKQVIRSIKMHSQLLTSVILSSPQQCQNSHTTNCMEQRSRVSSSSVTENQSFPNTNQQLCVELEHYIGDVLIAQCFMGHSIAGIVEGAPIICETKWVQKIIEDLMPSQAGNQNYIPASSFYRLWIYLHSTILRTAPFSRRQMNNLGLLPSHHNHHNHHNYDCTYPVLPFVGTRKHQWMAYLSRGRLGPIRITYNHFGTLGPTFRGRDRVQSFVVDPLTAIDIITKFDSVFEKSRQKSHENNGIASVLSPLHSSVLQSWITEQDPNIRWILDSHAEATKTRPMTVSPPIVIINSSSY